MKAFLLGVIDPNNAVYGWAIVVTLYLASIAFVIWHIYVLDKMSHDDKRARGGILILMLNTATATLFTLLGYDSIWRRFANAAAGVLILFGLIGLLWKFRFQRKTAALQPHIGDPSLPRSQSDTLGDKSTPPEQGDTNGFQKQ